MFNIREMKAEDKAVIIAQKRPAAMLGILLAQRVAEHG